jgi:hypothetical protein
MLGRLRRSGQGARMSAPTWRVFHSPRAGRGSGSRSFAETVCKRIGRPGCSVPLDYSGADFQPASCLGLKRRSRGLLLGSRLASGSPQPQPQNDATTPVIGRSSHKMLSPHPASRVDSPQIRRAPKRRMPADPPSTVLASGAPARRTNSTAQCAAAKVNRRGSPRAGTYRVELSPRFCISSRAAVTWSSLTFSVCKSPAEFAQAGGFTESLASETNRHLERLQSIGATVFRRWVDTIQIR